MKNVIQAVKGTRDFYPEQMAVRNWLYGIFREVSESFGYQEYEAPILESLELYAAKSGEELVMEQAYVFEDRGGSKIALRPELTPSLARMIAQKQNQLNFPVRWWSFGPFWRYERPQKGRTREFFQWNVDLLGIDSPEADAENVAVLAAFLEKTGLKADQVTIQVNDRRLMEEQFDKFDIPKGKRTSVYSWVDRRDKMPPDDWEAYGKEAGLNSKQLANMKSMLEDKLLWKQSQTLKRFFAASEAIGLNRYITFDPETVRGLQYYTGTVFEAWEIGGKIKRSILGGGRYDNLLQDVGGAPLPATGFAMGDVVITLVLQEYGLIPESIYQSKADLLVTVFDENQVGESLRLASELRSNGLKVSCYLEAAKIDKQIKFADRNGIPWVVFQGPDEIESGSLKVKSLKTGEQKSIPRAAFIPEMIKLLASDNS